MQSSYTIRLCLHFKEIYLRTHPECFTRWLILKLNINIGGFKYVRDMITQDKSAIKCAKGIAEDFWQFNNHSDDRGAMNI